MKHFYKFSEEAIAANDLMSALSLPQKKAPVTRAAQRKIMRRRAILMQPVGHCLYWGVNSRRYHLDSNMVCTGVVK